MPRKAGSRRKVVAPPVAAAAINDPTPERQQRDAFNVIPATRQVNEQLGGDRLVSIHGAGGLP